MTRGSPKSVDTFRRRSYNALNPSSSQAFCGEFYQLMQGVRQLSDLQEIDNAIDTRRKRLDKIESELRPTAELLLATQNLENEERVLRDLETAQGATETEVATTRDRISSLESRLYGNEVGNARELKNIETEIVHLKERQRVLEDRVLDVMAEVEEATMTASAQRAITEGTEEASAFSRKHLLEEREQIDTELPSLEAKRTKAAAVVPEASKRVYETLRTSKGGIAVAKVARNACGGCSIGLPHSVIQDVKSGKMFVQCSNCERLLVR